MTYNPSVRRFKTDMLDIANTVGKNFEQTLLAQADELIGNMKERVPVETGTLKESIRKKNVTRVVSIMLRNPSVLVIAGGSATTRRTKEGVIYDYAVSTEFGTKNEAPEPFFYNTARFYRNRGFELLRETLDQTIEKNNRVRAMRQENNDFGNAKVFKRYRGAVVAKGKL